MADLEVYEHDDDLDLIDEVDPDERQHEITAEIEEVTADLARLTREASALASAPPDAGGALVPTNQTPAQAKARLGVLRASVVRQQAVLLAKQEEIKEKQQEMERLMSEQMQLARAMLAPLEKFMARLSEGIWTVNLYLGRDEEIIVLADGEPADKDEPVVIRQMVLAMDEECAVNPEQDGIDSENIEEFDAWLQADPAHVEQVLPEQKGVVALRPRWRSKEHSDPWKQRAMAEQDARTYFLIRNGGKLYRTWTEFQASDRLVPTAEEFGAFFYEKHTSYKGGDKKVISIPLEPGTKAWEQAEEDADARQRHYMRVGLILQGLVDRTTVFHPLPEGGINFMDHEHGGRTWLFRSDAEKLLTTGRQSYRKWLDERNAQLRVGMRVVGAFNAYRGTRMGDEWSSRVHPRGAPTPPTGELLQIEDEASNGGLVVRYQRKGEIYDPKLWVPSETRPGWGHRGGYKTPKQRASCVLYASDDNIIPFDLVSEEEMLAYLNARLDRHAYADMFPLLKAAIRAKRQERELEAPFKTMLAGVLARDNEVEVADAEHEVDDLVEWFKLTNKNHRPLVGTEEEQSKAVRMIVTEHARRVKAAKKGVSPEMVENLREQHPDALLIARRRNGTYVVYSPHADSNVFVRVFDYGARGGPLGIESWKLLSQAQIARLLVGYQSEKVATWEFDASLRDHITGPEMERLVEEVTRDKKNLVAVAYHPEKRRFYLWRHVEDARIDEKHPISGELEQPRIDERQRTWFRHGTEVRLRDEGGSTRPKYSYQRKPWDTRPEKGVSPGWWDDKPVKDEEMRENRYQVVYYDAHLDAHVGVEQARYKAATGRESAMRTKVRGWLQSIEDAWVTRKEAVEYARFLEDYLDPELWAGHRKTLPRDTFIYPHHHHHGSFSSDTPDALALLVEYAVETGIDLDGLTAWEATEHYPPVEWIARRMRDDQWFERKDAKEAIDIPEDIRELRFTAPDEEADDDD